MMSDLSWCGKKIDDMSREELIHIIEHSHKFIREMMDRHTQELDTLIEFVRKT